MTNVEQMCHAVDTEHHGSNNASVVYIAACPTTETNKEYVRKQLASVQQGLPPPDYSADSDTDESKLQGYVGLDGLSTEAKAAYGFGL